MTTKMIDSLLKHIACWLNGEQRRCSARLPQGGTGPLGWGVFLSKMVLSQWTPKEGCVLTMKDGTKYVIQINKVEPNESVRRLQEAARVLIRIDGVAGDAWSDRNPDVARAVDELRDSDLGEGEIS